MFLVLIISLALIVYFICLEWDKPVQSCQTLYGQCPSCESKIESGWLVCPRCRTILRETCRVCDKVQDHWLKFCPWCGSSNRTEGQCVC
ncbi:MAG: zinc ribbon domain-containing protein [Deltaproteobacteria bacterium]|nr:zinc ribbon domain-containing protein [Deltaproteobacteria bacterium]